jgi:uncharacterized protein
VIIDVHTHIGLSHSTGVRSSPSALLRAMSDYRISASLVMPQATDPHALDLHGEIAEMARAQPGRAFGIALLDPRLSEPEYAALADRLLAQEGFVALKLHTLGHEVAPDDEVSDKVFRTARKFSRPVMIHTGLGGPHTLPQRALRVAMAYSDVPMILCHAGFGAFWREAIEVAEACDNVLLEPSWSPGFAIGLMVERIGAARVMFGSDHISNIPVELAKLGMLTLSAGERAAILAGNAIRVFNLPAAKR